MSCDSSGPSVLSEAISNIFFFGGRSTTGGIDQWTADVMACQAAIDQTRAMGLDPSDPVNADILQTNYEYALQDIQAQAQQAAASNPIQKQADILLGTATASTPVIGQTPKPPSQNFSLLIGFLVIMAVGFVLVFR